MVMDKGREQNGDGRRAPLLHETTRRRESAGLIGIPVLSSADPECRFLRLR
jgi:hypothetical protein